MKKIGLEEILNGLCDVIYITPGNNPPISYKVFKHAMLASDLFTTENSIKIRWQQLVANTELIESRGINPKGETTITLNIPNVYKYIRMKGAEPNQSLSHSLSQTNIYVKEETE